eukprot:3569826-Pleurochrysis_carterae.AAC.1
MAGTERLGAALAECAGRPEKHTDGHAGAGLGYGTPRGGCGLAHGSGEGGHGGRTSRGRPA